MKPRPNRLDLLKRKRDLLTKLVDKTERERPYVVAKIRKAFAADLRRAAQ